MDTEIDKEKESAQKSYKESNFADAIKHYEKAVELGDTDPISFASLGFSYMRSGQYEKAETLARKSIDTTRAEQKSPLRDAYLTLMYCLSLKKDNNSIISFSDEVLRRTDITPGGKSLALGYRGMAYLYLGKYDEALKDLDESLKIDPNQTISLQYRAEVYFQQKKYEESVQDLKTLQNLQPSEQTSKRMQEIEVFHNRDQAYKLSLTVFKQAQDLEWEEKYEEAAKVWKNYIGSHPPEEYLSKAYWMLGLIYVKQKRYEEAISAYKECIKYNPSLSEVYLNLARVYVKQDKDKEAIEMYNESIKQNPGSAAVTYGEIGNFYFQKKNYAEAQKYMEKAVELSPNNPGLKKQLGLIKGMQGDTASGIKILNEVLEKDPNNNSAKLGLKGLIEIRAGAAAMGINPDSKQDVAHILSNQDNPDVKTSLANLENAKKELMVIDDGKRYLEDLQELSTLIVEINNKPELKTFVEALKEGSATWKAVIESKTYQDYIQAANACNKTQEGAAFIKAKEKILNSEAGMALMNSSQELFRMPADYIIQRASTQKNMQAPELQNYRAASENLLKTSEGQEFNAALVKLQNTQEWKDMLLKLELLEEDGKFQVYLNRQKQLKELLEDASAPSVLKRYLSLANDTDRLRQKLSTNTVFLKYMRAEQTYRVTLLK